MDDIGILFHDLVNSNRIAHDYFHQLFLAGEAHYDQSISQSDHKLLEKDNYLLLALFTMDEFKTSLFHMYPDKSPGPDRYNLAFF